MDRSLRLAVVEHVAVDKDVILSLDIGQVTDAVELRIGVDPLPDELEVLVVIVLDDVGRLGLMVAHWVVFVPAYDILVDENRPLEQQFLPSDDPEARPVLLLLQLRFLELFHERVLVLLEDARDVLLVVAAGRGQHLGFVLHVLLVF